MQKRLFSVLASLGLVIGVMAIAPAAQAQDTTIDSVASLLPNDDWADTDALSDLDDGQNETAHLTSIADPAATQTTWYICESGSDPGDTPCVTAGTDTSGVQPAGGDPDPDEDSGAAEAYELEYDVPASLDSDTTGDNYDIWVVACAGTPALSGETVETSANCETDTEFDIYLDDADTDSSTDPFEDNDEVPTGEIALFCSGGEGGGVEFPIDLVPDETAIEECDEVDEGEPFPHGTSLPSGDLAVGFTTSDDVTEASACIELTGDAGFEDQDVSAQEDEDVAIDGEEALDGCDFEANFIVKIDPDNAAAPATGQGWIAYFADGDVPEGQDLTVAIFGNDPEDEVECVAGGDYPNGAGTALVYDQDADATSVFIYTDDLCVFDVHYASTEDTSSEELTASFDVADADDDEDGCNEDETVNDEETNLIDSAGDADGEEIEGCEFDQFGEPIEDPEVTGGAGADAVFQLEGVGEFTDTADCDAQDLDDDDNDFNEVAVCDGTGGDDEADEYDVDWIATDADGDGVDDAGTSNITFCIDAEGEDDTDDEFGCADEENTASIVKTVAGAAVDVELVFETPGQDPADPCATGDKFRTNQEDDQDTLIVCTYDLNGVLVSTDEAELGGTDNGELFWTNTGVGIVAFNGNPVEETGADGTATQDITAVNEGGATITANLDSNGDGDSTDADDDTSAVTKSVEEQQVESQCNDNVDNDGDGATDYPADPGCAGLEDNSENTDQVINHDRSAKITRFKHVSLGNGKSSLRVRGKVSAPDFPDCKAFVPVKVQLKAGGSFATRKGTSSNQNGGFKVLIRDVTGLYKAVASEFQFTDGQGNLHICEKASGKRRHKHN